MLELVKDVTERRVLALFAPMVKISVLLGGLRDFWTVFLQLFEALLRGKRLKRDPDLILNLSGAAQLFWILFLPLFCTILFQHLADTIQTEQAMA